jgi:hypothetical protein
MEKDGALFHNAARQCYGCHFKVTKLKVNQWPTQIVYRAPMRLGCLALRIILLHQSIYGLDAKGLVRELIDSPAYASAAGRSQIGLLLYAIVCGYATINRNASAKRWTTPM